MHLQSHQDWKIARCLTYVGTEGRATERARLEIEFPHREFE